jgi:non-specific serine/threonine protein kinase
VTLTGPGGAGKTRLALQAAAGLMEEHPDGVRFAELAALSDAGLVPAVVAAAVGVREVSGQPILEALVEHLKDKRALLVLDNCEHLLQACAQLADALLREAPQVRLLATSREPLGTYGEAIYRVPSLTLPDALRPVDPEELSRFEAVRLFRDRAEHAQPGFQVTRGNGPALVSVCRRLDGIPLALELAAARVRSLTVEEIDRGLDQRFLLLTGGSRTALPRQQTLQSLIDWSYDLLNAREKALLNRLSVFAGGWTLAAAENVCPGEPLEEWEILDLLASLADKSLVIANPVEGITRYRLLETVRQYAAERLRESGEAAVWRRSHLDYLTHLGQEAEPHLGGPEQKAWMERLDHEHDNLRAALEWAAESEPEAGLRLMGAAWRFWDLRGYHNEARKLLTAILERSDPAHRTGDRARALHAAGLFAYRQGDPPAAGRHYEASLEIAREIGDGAAIASALNQLGNVAWIQGDYPMARVRHEESLQLRNEIGDRRGVGASLNNLGNLAQRLGDLDSARACLEQSLEICREFGDTTGIAITLNNLGNTLRLQGDPAAARETHQECLRLRREMGDPVGVASSLNNLAMALHDLGELAEARKLLEEGLQVKRGLGDRVGVAQSLGNLAEIAYDLADYPAARSLYRESVGLFAEMGDPWGVAGALEGLAGVLGAQGRDPLTARLLGFTGRLRQEIGAEIPTHERPRYERQLAHARAASPNEEAFQAALEEGRVMSLEEATELALAATDN